MGRCFAGDFELEPFDAQTEELMAIASKEKIGAYWHEVCTFLERGNDLGAEHSELTMTGPRTLGILEVGAPPSDFSGRFDGYAAMVGELLGEAFAYRAYNVPAGELPKQVTQCDVWLVTGSAAGVYDPEPWIAPLKGFIQATSGQTPMVGICFGHQLMAEAFGGQVIKSPKGWGIGLHRYDVSRPAAWMDDVAPVSLPVSHQDQVVGIGDGAEVLGGSDFTPFGMIAYPQRRALTIQAHPEFTPDYAKALIALRRGKRFDEAHADAALATFADADDRKRVGGWIARFLTTA